MARRTGLKERICSRSTPFSAWGYSSLADLALTLIMAVWGSSFAILRSLLGAAEASPLLLVAVRMALASALLGGFMAVAPGCRAQLRAIRGELLRDGMFAGGLLGIGFLLQTEGLQRTTASRSGFLTGTLVVMGPLIEFGLFRKRPTLAPRLWAALLYLAVFATLLAFGIQTWAQKVLPPVRVALISALEPVFAALWAAVLIGERLTLHELAGGALIVLGVAVGEAGAMLRARARTRLERIS